MTLLLIAEAMPVIINKKQTPSYWVLQLIPHEFSQVLFRNTCHCEAPPQFIIRTQRAILLVFCVVYLALVILMPDISWLPIIIIITLSAISATIGLCPIALFYAMYLKYKSGDKK